MQTADITELELPVLKSAFKQVTGNVLKTKDEDEAREALTEALKEAGKGLFFDEDGDLAIEDVKPAKKAAKAKEPEPEEEIEEEEEEEVEEEKPAPKKAAKAEPKKAGPPTKKAKADDSEEETVEKPAKKGASKKGVKPDFTRRIKGDAVLELGESTKNPPREGSILGDALAAIEDGMTYDAALKAIKETFDGSDKKPNAAGIISNFIRRGAVKIAA